MRHSQVLSPAGYVFLTEQHLNDQSRGYQPLLRHCHSCYHLDMREVIPLALTNLLYYNFNLALQLATVYASFQVR